MLRLALCCLALLYFPGWPGTVMAQSQVKSSQTDNSTKKGTEMKTANAFYTTLEGDWKGSYSLWLRPGTPAQTSETRANFRPAAKGNYFLMTYSWKRGEETHEGVFLLGGKGKAATATWGDSFHSVPEPLQSRGELQEDGKKLTVTGSYSIGEGPAWGWRTEFTRQGSESLLMEAYNITPNGEEALAVKAELTRVTGDEK